MRLGRDDLYLNIDTGVGVLYVFPDSIRSETHALDSYGQDLALVCHQFLYKRSFKLQDLMFDEPEEIRASPSTRQKKKKELEVLTRFIKGLEVTVNFKTTKRYPRRKILDLYPRAGRYEFVLEKADKKEKRVVTVEVCTIAIGHWRGF